MATWHATITAPAVAHVEPITMTLPGFPGTQSDERVLTVWFDVEAPTLRQAVDSALRAARVVDGVNSIRVEPYDDYICRIEHPTGHDLVGVSEIAGMLGVTKQRAREVAASHAEFPAPVARPSMGPVWTRDSVSGFVKRWQRRRTGRPRKVA